MKREKIHICCKHVLKGERDIMLVVRTEEGFQFLCGEEHGEDEEPELIDIDDVIRMDNSLSNVRELKINHLIERNSLDEPWILRYYGES